MHKVPTGLCTIRNIGFDQNAFLATNADEVPVTGADVNPDTRAQWIISEAGEYYTIRNNGTKNFAYTQPNSKPGDIVVGYKDSKRFKITEYNNGFKISTSDTELYWSLPMENGTVTLIQDEANWKPISLWYIQNVGKD